MKKQWILRAVIYAIGVMILVVGATLGTKTGLGIDPVNAIPFALDGAFGIGFPFAVFIFFSILIVLEFLIRGKHRRWRDLLQLPFSFVFSALLGVLGNVLQLPNELLWQRVLLLAMSIVLTGVGVSMIVNMQIVPNPADGMAQTLSCAMKKEMGLAKNIFDLTCVSTAFLIDLLFGTLWTSVGIGTVFSTIFIGRVIALFNRCFQKKMLVLAGLQE